MFSEKKRNFSIFTFIFRSIVRTANILANCDNSHSGMVSFWKLENQLPAVEQMRTDGTYEN